MNYLVIFQSIYLCKMRYNIILILQPLFIVNWLINLCIIEIFPEENISYMIFYQNMIKLSQKDMMVYMKLYGNYLAEIHEIPKQCL
jgi:hypothetical protein